jgi:hypothetical protein
MAGFCSAFGGVKRCGAGGGGAASACECTGGVELLLLLVCCWCAAHLLLSSSTTTTTTTAATIAAHLPGTKHRYDRVDGATNVAANSASSTPARSLLSLVNLLLSGAMDMCLWREPVMIRTTQERFERLPAAVCGKRSGARSGVGVPVLRCEL